MTATTLATGTATKKVKIIYWIATGLLALWEISGSFFMNSQMAIDGMKHLGLPDWFRWELNIGHLIGGLLLILPVGWRLKEWTYVAFGIDYISAFIAIVAIDGLSTVSFTPIIMLVILVVSYVYYHKLKDQ